MSPLVALTIAGTDSGGGAGVTADLATFADHGLHGTAVVTAVTAQDTVAVRAIHPVPLEVVAAQLDAVLADLAPAVVKAGMLGSAEVAHLVAGWCAATATRPLVVDPVLRSTTGTALADPALLSAYLNDLLPVATVVTPNASEARALLGETGHRGAETGHRGAETGHRGAETGRRDLAVALADQLGGPAVIVTGGPEQPEQPEQPAPPGQPGQPNRPAARTCTDWLARPGFDPVAIEHAAVATVNDHGTGCTYASALASRLAHGADLATAARDAASYTARQLVRSSTWDLGAGRGPVAHLPADPRTTKEIPA